jgi:hypothetical protein
MLFLAMQAHVLEYYDQTVSSPSGSFYIPAVLRVHIYWFFSLLRVVTVLRCHHLLLLCCCSGSTVAAGSKEKKGQAEP